jgi:hypothetical protein
MTMRHQDEFTHPNTHNKKPFFKKIIDPQIIVEGNLRQGPRADVIVFRLRIMIVDITCVVTVPPDGETKAPVYVKFRIDTSQSQAPGSVVISDHAGHRTPRVYGQHESNLNDNDVDDDSTHSR